MDLFQTRLKLAHFGQHVAGLGEPLFQALDSRQQLSKLWLRLQSSSHENTSFTHSPEISISSVHLLLLPQSAFLISLAKFFSPLSLTNQLMQRS